MSDLTFRTIQIQVQPKHDELVRVRFQKFNHLLDDVVQTVELIDAIMVNMQLIADLFGSDVVKSQSCRKLVTTKKGSNTRNFIQMIR